MENKLVNVKLNFREMPDNEKILFYKKDTLEIYITKNKGMNYLQFNVLFLGVEFKQTGHLDHRYSTTKPPEYYLNLIIFKMNEYLINIQKVRSELQYPEIMFKNGITLLFKRSDLDTIEMYGFEPDFNL